MRCVQVQEMPPNPTHWTFSGLFFFFKICFSSTPLTVVVWRHYVFRKSHSCSLLQCRNQGWFGFLWSQIRSVLAAWPLQRRLVPFQMLNRHVTSFSLTLFYVSVCLCCIINIFLKMHQEKVRGQGHYDLTPVSFLWVNKHKVSCSRRCVPPQALQFHWCWASGDCRCTLCQSSPSILFLLELIHWNHTCWYCDNLLFLHVAACQAVRQLS